MITWEADNGLTFHYGNNGIQPYPGSQSCCFRIDLGKNGRMHELVSGPAIVFLETGDKLTSDCLPSVLR
ncbi:hypothetical protein ACWCW7_18775 [Nocardia tengchongensis]